MTAALPVTVLGGYLGAGKTTLVNHLLRNANGLRIAVLVNEFGTLPIDADLIEARDGNLLAIAGGCICCSYGSDLVAALMEMTQRRDQIDHLLIEASGVALPGAIAQSLSLIAGTVLDAVVVLADAETLRARGADRYMGDTITRQLADADLVVLNKIDLVSDASLAATQAWVQETAPRAARLTARHSALPLELVLGLNAPQRSTFALPTHRTGGLDTVAFDVDGPVDVAAFAEGLADEVLGLVRAKGFVESADGQWHTLQVVGRRASISPAPSHITGSARLVCITHGQPVDRARITETIARYTVTPARVACITANA